MASTIMSGTGNADKSNLKSITNYALFMGGTNTTNEVLRAYDPLTTGFARIFMVRKPAFLVDKYSNEFAIYKHILEYGFTAINGLGSISVQDNQVQGGYTNRAFSIPAMATDETSEFSIQVYEFSGSPMRTINHLWINGMSDILNGVTHLNGSDVDAIQANMTAEFIYYVTDRTTKNIEYACLFTNCYPKSIDLDPFNYQSGEHNIVQQTINYSTVKYESIQINKVAAALNNKYRILANSLNFYSGIKSSGTSDNDTKTGSEYEKGQISIGESTHFPGKYYNIETGMLADADSNANMSTFAPRDESEFK